MKKCPYCDRVIRDDAFFCTYCGREVTLALSSDERKKCPYCAEWIMKEAIVCRFCNRDITNDVDKDRISPKMQDAKTAYKKADLTVGDYEDFLNGWAASYGYIPPEINKKIATSATEIIRAYLPPVIEQYIRHRLATEQELTSILTSATAITCQWGTLCFAVGVEGSLGNINNNDVPYYLHAFTKPITDYLLGFTGILMNKGKLKKRKAGKIYSMLTTNVNKTAVFLANQGFLNHESVKARPNAGSPSSLLIELMKIDIKNIKASMS